MSGRCNAAELGNLTSLIGEFGAKAVCNTVDVRSLGVQGAALAYTFQQASDAPVLLVESRDHAAHGSLTFASPSQLSIAQRQIAIDAETIANITGNVTSTISGLAYGLNSTWILYGAFMVFFMQTGFAIFVAGVVRAKNIGDVLLKSAIDTCISAICFYCIGYGLAFGVGSTAPNGFIGNGDFALSQLWDTPQDAQYWVWYWAFCATSVTIMAGSVAERATFISYCIFSAFYSIWVFPVSSHWHWSPYGWLSPLNPKAILGMGCIDYAGSGVVHTMGGYAALVGGYILGPRVGRFDPGVPPGMYRNGQNPPLYLLGTFLLWFAWFSFNTASGLQTATTITASTAGRTAVCTALSAAAGGITNSAVTYWRTKTWQMLSICGGILGGLVAITAGCSVVEPWAAIICGAVAGPMVYLGGELLEWLQIDDPAEAFPIHGFSGVWGVMFVGLLAKEQYVNEIYGKPLGQGYMGIFYGGHGQLLLNQFISVVVMIAWVVANVGILFLIMNYFGILRIGLEVEAVGIDSGLMGGALGGAGFSNPLEAKINDTSIRVAPGSTDRSTGRGDYSASGRGRGAYRPSNLSNNNPSGSYKYTLQSQFATIEEGSTPGHSKAPGTSEIQVAEAVGVMLDSIEGGSNVSIPQIAPIHSRS